MMLFENEMIHISRIHTVNKYETHKEDAGKSVEYTTDLAVYELIFFFEGGDITYFGDVVIKDAAGSVRYLPKGITAGRYRVEQIQPGFCIDIYFDTPDPMPKQALGFQNMEELRNLFRKIYHIWNGKKNGYYSEAMSVFYDIIRHFQTGQDSYLSCGQTEKIKPSYDYLLENFAKHDFDYQKMCDLSGLSYDYFKDLFIARFRESPVRYVTRLRMERARELLITQRYSVTEVARLCGFENIYYFSTVFKKEHGVPPSQYKGEN